jgi:hypothetical protein
MKSLKRTHGLVDSCKRQRCGAISFSRFSYEGLEYRGTSPYLASRIVDTSNSAVRIVFVRIECNAAGFYAIAHRLSLATRPRLVRAALHASSIGSAQKN